jgi:hypothetical protein
VSARRITAVSLATLAIVAACGVDDLDLASKTCPCPADLACDASTNRCVPAGTLKPTATIPCVARSCAELGVECGATNDGCGGALDCGKCSQADRACNADLHACVCQPQNCAAQGAECGEVPSGCGDTFKCPACPPSLPNCGGAGPNRCGVSVCVPETCASLGACGLVSDRCGGILDCKGCAAPETCGGGGVPNRCGCTPQTCAQVGWQCGSGPDGCGGTRTCAPCAGGACNARHICCGVTPTCASLGWQCGSGADGCGGTLTCPACATGRCDRHVCE